MKTIWLLAASIAVLSSTPSRAADAEPLPNAAETPATELTAAQQMAAAVLASVRANNERLQAMELSITKDFLDRSVTEDGPVEERLPNGGMIVSERRRQARSVERAVVLEDQVRIETGGDSLVPRVIYVFDGVRWTRANDRNKEISRMRPEQLGGRSFDPREVVGVDARTTLANLLAPEAVRNAKLESAGTVSTITADITGGRVVMQFDSAFNLLPTKSQWFHPDGGLIREALVTYAWVPERSAWIIKTLTEHYYDLTASTQTAPAEWKQELQTSVISKPLDRSVAETEFAVAVPDGYQVNDHTQDSSRNRQLKPRSPVLAASESTWKWFILAHVVLFLSAAGLYFWRRRRASPARI